MRRALADEYLFSLATVARGPCADDVHATVRRLGPRVVRMTLPEGVQALATERSIHVQRDDADALAMGLAQYLLLRLAVAHVDGDVCALARMLSGAAQAAEHDSDAIHLDIDSSRN